MLNNKNEELKDENTYFQRCNKHGLGTLMAGIYLTFNIMLGMIIFIYPIVRTVITLLGEVVSIILICVLEFGILMLIYYIIKYINNKIKDSEKLKITKYDK